MIYAILTALTIASSEPVTLEAHPDCNLQATEALTYNTETDLICITPDVAFRDVIFKGDFDD